MNNKSKQQTIVWIALVITGLIVIAGFAINYKNENVQNNQISSKTDLENIVDSAQTWGADFQSWYGKQSPDFTFTDINGKSHSLSDYRGKNVLVVFWATWCPPCNEEIPNLIELRKKHPEDELEIIAISDESPEQLKGFVKTKGINYNVVSQSGMLPEPFLRLFWRNSVSGN